MHAAALRIPQALWHDLVLLQQVDCRTLRPSERAAIRLPVAYQVMLQSLRDPEQRESPQSPSRGGEGGFVVNTYKSRQLPKYRCTYSSTFL